MKSWVLGDVTVKVGRGAGRRSGGREAGAGARGTRGKREREEGEQRKEESGWVGRSLTPCPSAISAGGSSHEVSPEATAKRRGERGGGGGAWVAVR